MCEVVHLDVHVSSKEEEVKKLVLMIRPKWDIAHIQMKPLSGGLVNFLWKVWREKNNKHTAAVTNGTGDTTHHDTDDDIAADTEDDILTIKIFGAGGDDLLDRQKEKILMEALHTQRVSAPLYAVFENGFVYRYVQGSTLSPQQLLDPKISRLVIEKMHRIHCFQTPASIRVPGFDMGKFYIRRVVKDWNALVATENMERVEHKLGVGMDELSKELAELDSCYQTLSTDFPTCFCHFDMHVMNLLYDNRKDELDVVDWEFAGPTVEVYEIGAHFITDPDRRIHDAGIIIPDHPDKIRQFVRAYLGTHPQYKDQAQDEKLIQKWFTGVYKSMYIIGMTNFAWALCQPMKEATDFMAFAVPQYDAAQMIKRMLNGNWK